VCEFLVYIVKGRGHRIAARGKSDAYLATNYSLFPNLIYCQHLRRSAAGRTTAYHVAIQVCGRLFLF